MDRLVRLFHGGIVKENEDFENMTEDVEFDISPCFKDLVDGVMAKHCCGVEEISLRARAHYVLMKLESEGHWMQYKDIVNCANVVYWEVVVEINRTTRRHDTVERVDEIPILNTQGSTISQDVPIVSSGVCALDFDMAIASDDFEDCTFEEEDAAMDDDDVSLGSEENEYDIGANFDDEHNEEEAEEEDGLEENVEEELRKGSIPSDGNRDDG
ncbi:hypothetical protein GQ55_1G137700 [Panicum hallii var. hallii]|uniref:Transposase MuDR plant domain-containing protein n=1 Tax=Panicum hallii var. hallii TaxID=1504633 RepID=A0A2T7F592_9POAL|nr:hypothetical protein GQ55_1G137700 [Panicum hallii var. hallii]